MYTKDIQKKLDRKLGKLLRKDPVLAKEVDNKIEEILLNPHHYKPLQWPLQNQRRVHMKHHVLVFQINEEKKTVEFIRFEHHDEAYLG